MPFDDYARLVSLVYRRKQEFENQMEVSSFVGKYKTKWTSTPEWMDFRRRAVATVHQYPGASAETLFGDASEWSETVTLIKSSRATIHKTEVSFPMSVQTICARLKGIVSQLPRV